MERKNWDCEVCITKELYKRRNCPLDIGLILGNEEKVGEESDPNAAKAKYGFNINKKKRAEPQEVVPSQDASNSIQEEDLDEEEAKRRPVIIQQGSYKFYECPMPSLIENYMTPEERFANFIIQIIEWSETTGVMPVPVGLLDQSNVYFEARSIVVQEKNKCEFERQEQQRKEREAQDAKSKAVNSQNKGRRRGR